MLAEGGRDEEGRDDPLGVMPPHVHRGLLLHPHTCWTCVRDRQASGRAGGPTVSNQQLASPSFLHQLLNMCPRAGGGGGNTGP